jgi:hypothetical protein
MCCQELNRCLDPPPPNDGSRKQKLDYLHRPSALRSQLESQMETHTTICTQ